MFKVVTMLAAGKSKKSKGFCSVRPGPGALFSTHKLQAPVSSSAWTDSSRQVGKLPDAIHFLQRYLGNTCLQSIKGVRQIVEQVTAQNSVPTFSHANGVYEQGTDRATDRIAKAPAGDFPGTFRETCFPEPSPTTGRVPQLQLKSVNKTIPEDVPKGMHGSFELFLEDKSAPKKGGLDGYIMFTPSRDSRTPDSTKIGLVQIAKVVNDETGIVFDVTKKYPQLKLPKAIMTQEDKKKGIKAGFYIDKPYHEMKKGKPFSKFYIERPPGIAPGERRYAIPTKKGRFVDQHGYKHGSNVKPAILTDAPEAPYDATFSFETYAQSDSKTYGGVRWGFKIKPEPALKSFNKHVSDGILPPVIEPTTVAPIFSLSPTASEAIKRFEKELQPILRKKHTETNMITLKREILYARRFQK